MTGDAPDDWRERLTDLHAALSGKWALHVLGGLRDGPRAFGDLRGHLDGVPEKTLARRLRDLRLRGLIRREVAATSPPTPRYRLTAAGERLVAALDGVTRSVEYVDCPAELDCDDDCRVGTVDGEATRHALADCC
ncbi:winged helix-turn-helix transcriptional regulator [Halobaculum lipolyticum]|uniref:Winged helix-turn-helix transcriptional regulator n=1 Tax=Halobaculum lipolyticum TaxID=3032001 RepID=A0ABD5W583_9EURY|nr:winged helix-turn-helix transcriptional regulator [Halobaculum sp. DT31]